ncbi:HMA2 domain-containing protein [Peptostreptococcus faecalis]|uniref:HMA2 domain-containing protein n=1 Tax=Peptostreptococcus faecalis TaxID=2045015 RepID=UPI000C7DF4F5|nr:heavy-metal-associated domain-containing protein [Peptostreptococcus faecalis]
MFSLKAAIFNLFFKFEVLSDLPGRLRLKVNNYKKLPKEAANYQQYAIEAIERLDGIEDVKFNFVIGTVLITYDNKKTSSQKIINWIKSIKNLVVTNVAVINSLTGKSEEEAKEILFGILDKHIEGKN